MISHLCGTPLYLKEVGSLRNKVKNFPSRISLDADPRAKPKYASKRADGTINTQPQERMAASSKEAD